MNSGLGSPGGIGESIGPPSIVRRLDELIVKGHRFRTVLADPPWQYENTASRGAAENHYPTMSVAEICDTPVTQLAEDDSHLHLWTTTSFLEAGLIVMRGWGFEYKSCLVWIKPTLGMGNYWRISHEYLQFWHPWSVALPPTRSAKLGLGSTKRAQ